ncbi:hypothetical protein GS942_20825 [Rhodococcus hoagii]|nr:hypothetical protein [Prescottella equi]
MVLNKVPPRSREADFRAAELGDALGDRLWDHGRTDADVLTEARGARDPITPTAAGPPI